MDYYVSETPSIKETFYHNYAAERTQQSIYQLYIGDMT